MVHFKCQEERLLYQLDSAYVSKIILVMSLHKISYRLSEVMLLASSCPVFFQATISQQLLLPSLLVLHVYYVDIFSSNYHHH